MLHINKLRIEADHDCRLLLRNLWETTKAGKDLIVDSKKMFAENARAKESGKKNWNSYLQEGTGRCFLIHILNEGRKVAENYSVMCGCEFYVPL